MDESERTTVGRFEKDRRHRGRAGESREGGKKKPTYAGKPGQRENKRTLVGTKERRELRKREREVVYRLRDGGGSG